MSDDDFGLSFEDERELAAATADLVTAGKRNFDDHSENAMLPAKRPKCGDEPKTAPSPNAVLANRILKERFGLIGFRLEQEAAVTRLLDGGSAVVVFPTGGGKSLCYQVSELSGH